MIKQEFLILMIEKRAEFLLLKNMYENDDIDHETLHEELDFWESEGYTVEMEVVDND